MFKVIHRTKQQTQVANALLIRTCCESHLHISVLQEESSHKKLLRSICHSYLYFQKWFTSTSILNFKVFKLIVFLFLENGHASKQAIVHIFSEESREYSLWKIGLLNLCPFVCKYIYHNLFISSFQGWWWSGYKWLELLRPYWGLLSGLFCLTWVVCFFCSK